MITGLKPIDPTLTQGASGDTPERILEAGRQFEALLLTELLKSAREAGSQEGDAASSTMLEVAEQELGKMLAARGGLGIAKLIARGLERQPPEVKR